MAQVSKSEVQAAKDAWDRAVAAQQAADARWEREGSFEANAEQAATRKAQVKAWKAWDRAERRWAA